MRLTDTVELYAGGPGSGRRKEAQSEEKPVAKILKKKWKNQTEEERRKVAHNDPRQRRLFSVNEGTEPPVGVYSRKPPSQETKNQAGGVEALGEPDVPQTGAHIDPVPSYRPPSLRNSKRVPADDPGETDDRFLDVTKRKEAQEERMKILKRNAPAGLPALIPVGTTGVAPHSGTYNPLMCKSTGLNPRRKKRQDHTKPLPRH